MRPHIMTLNQAYAKIYDTIYFHLMYFNGVEINDGYNSDDDEANSNQLYSEISTGLQPPRILYPFFKFSSDRPCIISYFFSKETDDPLTIDIDSFTKCLLAKSDRLYEITLNETFSEYERKSGKKVVPSASPSDFVTAIDNLKGSTEYKLQTALLFNNFTYAVDLLIDSMKKVHKKVSWLHENYKDRIEKAASEIEANNYLQAYAEKFRRDLGEVDDTKTLLTITLLNQYVVYWRKNNNRLILAMLGLRHNKYAGDAMENVSGLFSDFVIASGSVLRMKMLEGLAEKREMTLSDFARYVDSQPTTVIRNLQILKNSNIIVVSRHEAQQIFYKINTEHLAKVRKDCIDFIDRLMYGSKTVE